MVFPNRKSPRRRFKPLAGFKISREIGPDGSVGHLVDMMLIGPDGRLVHQYNGEVVKAKASSMTSEKL